MIIQPILAPTLSDLVATPALKSNLLKWSTLNDPILFGTEIWGSKTNDRSVATLLATVYNNAFIHGTESGETWYYWIRAVSVYGRSDGPWFPTSSTAGVSSTALLTQTVDIAPNATTNVSVAQGAGSIVQTNYSVWENLFSIPFLGSGNKYLISVSHAANANLATVGTSQGLKSVERLTVNEYTVYKIGTASVTAGSTIVTGVGTSWLANVVAGNYFFVPGGYKYLISSVNSNTQLTLSSNYVGSTMSGLAYFIITNVSAVLVLSQDTRNLNINGTYLLSSNQQFNHKWALDSVIDKLYDIILDWTIVRDNASWSYSQTSVLRTVILEELKR